MILRLVMLMSTGAGAYLLLRGWPEEIPELLRACLALLILLGGLILWSARGGRGADTKSEGDVVMKTGRKPGWMDYGSLGLGLLALECGFLWVLSAAPEPLERAALILEERFFISEDGGQVSDAPAGEGQVSGNWLWDGEDVRALPRRANLKLGTRPEVFVRFLRDEDVERLGKQQIYVRAFALDVYLRGVWSGFVDDERMLEADKDGWIRNEEKVEHEIAHEIYHGKDPAGRNFVTALQGVRAVRLPKLKRVGDGREFLPVEDDQKGYQYFASSLPLGLKDVSDVEWGRADHKVGDQRLRDLTLRVAGEGGTVVRLLAIESYLKENFRYSLVVENPDNLDPMENFLYGERKGHCEFFATAGALMARELGVESRVAYGWSSGQYLAARKMYVFRARDAHAWVEVKVPGYGWVVMEPTPSSAFHRGVAEMEELETEDEPDLADLYQSDEGSADESGGGLSSWAVLSVAAACGLSAYVIVMLRRKRFVATDGSDSGSMRRVGDSAGYVAAWRMVMERRGGTVRGRTMREQVLNLDEKPEFGVDLVAYYYGVTYEGEKRDRDVEKELEQRIRELQ